MNIKRLKKIEWLIPICAIILCGISLVALYSASYDAGLDEFKKQVMWMGISFILMIVVAFIDYKILVKLSPILYGLAILLLIAVLFTDPINGARSWFNIKDGLFSFQPAEIRIQDTSCLPVCSRKTADSPDIRCIRRIFFRYGFSWQ